MRVRHKYLIPKGIYSFSMLSILFGFLASDASAQSKPQFDTEHLIKLKKPKDKASKPKKRTSKSKPKRLYKAPKKYRSNPVRRFYRYWGPKVYFVYESNREYWSPKAKFVYDANREYWGPKIRFVTKANKEFWIPKYQFVIQANKEYWIPKIEYQYLPYIRKNYKRLNKNYGKSISRHYKRTMKILRPVVVEFPAFLFRTGYRKLPKRMRYSLENVPAPVKIAFDKYHRWSLKHVAKMAQRSNKQLPKQMRAMVRQLTSALHSGKDILLQRRLDKLLKRLRPYVEDPGMRSCYRAYALRSSVVNAFNTGCSVYVTSALANQLTDMELLAVMAHELAHGDKGHAVKNLGLLARSAGEHAYHLISDEIKWILTGKWGKTLQQVVNKGNVTQFLKTFGEKAPAVEIEADQCGAKILLRAGISPRYMISALMKLHQHNPSQPLDKHAKNFDALRDYPSLYKRVMAIKQVWKKALPKLFLSRKLKKSKRSKN